MSGRQPVCEDSAAISARLAELRAERMAAIAGCRCQQRSTTGEVVHTPLCPMRAEAPSQMQLTLDAIARARARLRQAGAPIREEADSCAGVPPRLSAQDRRGRRPAAGIDERADEIIAEGIAAKYARHRVLTEWKERQ